MREGSVKRKKELRMVKNQKKVSKSFRSLSFSKFTRFDLFFVVLVVCLSVFLIFNLKDFKQLPSCYFGCDLHHHMGTMEHLSQGGSYFENAQLGGGMSWTPQFYHIGVVWFAKVLGLSLVKANVFFSVLIFILTCLVFYFFLNLVFKDLNLFTALIPLLVFSSVPVLKYRSFTYVLVLPFFLFFLYKFYCQKSWRSSFLLALFYGLLANSHQAGFMVGTVVLVLLLVYDLIFKEFDNFKSFVSFDFSRVESSYKQCLIFCLVVGVVSFLLSLFYWHWPLVNGFEELNPINEYGHNNYESFSLIVKDVFDIFGKNFFNFSSFFYSLRSLFVLAGLFFLFFSKVRKGEENKFVFVRVLFVALVGVTVHHIITEPLFSRSVFPYLLNAFLFYSLKFFLVFLALEKFVFIFKRYFFLRYVLFVLFFVLFVFSSVSHLNSYMDKNYSKVALNDVSEYNLALRSWVLSNTNLSDVFLTSKESCFMLNGFTGRKCLIYRNTHTDLFTDVFRRDADSAVILYGNNSELREELIRRYDLDYLFWDVSWYGSEFVVRDGRLVGFADTIKIPYSVESESYFKENGVNYIVKDGEYLDPSYKRGYNVYKVIIPIPFFNNSRPWSDDLFNYVEPVWNVSLKGEDYSMIYRFKKLE